MCLGSAAVTWVLWTGEGLDLEAHPSPVVPSALTKAPSPAKPGLPLRSAAEESPPQPTPALALGPVAVERDQRVLPTASAARDEPQSAEEVSPVPEVTRIAVTPAVPTPPSAKLRLESGSLSAVWMLDSNGRSYEIGPRSRTSVPLGTYDVWATLEGSRRFMHRLEVEVASTSLLLRCDAQMEKCVVRFPTTE